MVTKHAAKQSKAAGSPRWRPMRWPLCDNAGFSRRAFLKGAGALIVTFSATSIVGTAFGQGRGRGGPWTRPSPILQQLDSWLAINADGSVTAYTGKVELGQGISTAQIQLSPKSFAYPSSASR